jgi:hypothetical protein
MPENVGHGAHVDAQIRQRWSAEDIGLCDPVEQ